MQSLVRYSLRLLRSFARGDGGSILILFAASLIVLAALAGMAVDYGRAVRAETSLQEALDAAVLAAAKADPGSQTSKGTAVFKENLRRVEVQGVEPKFTLGSDGRVTGVVHGEVGTTLLGMLNIKSMPMDVRSTAIAERGSSACVIALAPSSTNALLVNSGTDVSAPDCEIHVRSTAKPAAIFNSCSKLDTKRICIAGKRIIDNGGIHPRLESGCAANADPYAGMFPEPEASRCTYTSKSYNGGPLTLNPGVYCGQFNFNSAPSVTFRPGTYIIKGGGWNVNGGTWNGSGVTFYFADQSRIQFNSAVAVQISPPTSGTYRGIVMFEKAGLRPSPMLFNDSRGISLQGIVYLPSRDVTFNGGSQLTSKSMSLVIRSLILNQTRWTLAPSPYATSGAGAVSSVRLIE